MSTLLNFDLKAFESARLCKLAQTALETKPRTITSAINPRSPGGAHDFSSEADYWWPDSANPDGPYLQRDGLTNPDNFTVHRELLLDFSENVGLLVAACLVTDSQKYAQAALAHLQAWFVVPSTRMNPNLQFAQAIKGICTGRAIGLIDTVHLAEVALAVKALHQKGFLKTQDYNPIVAWFAEYLEWLCTHPYGIEESNWPNNHGTCWALQAATFAKLSNNTAVTRDCRRRLIEVLLPNQMAENGSFPKELARTKPYGYAIFNLDVMTALGQVLSSQNENILLHKLEDGRSIIRGVEYLAPFLENKANWPFAHDVMYWDNWPVRQASLIFGAFSAGRDDWLALWKQLDPAPTIFEIRRNMPIRNPIIWLSCTD